MLSTEADAPTEAKITRGQIAAAVMGNALEFYDFTTYALFAVQIGKVFFPSHTPFQNLMLSLLTFSVGFVARPIGAVVLGAFGDRVGRKSMLLVTLLMMGVPTIIIGVIPTYDQIGYWAPALLVLMRIIQGLAVGGEWGGAVLMAVEHAPAGKKGFFGSLHANKPAARYGV